MTRTNHQIETKIVKGPLDFIILQLLNTQPMTSHQIITQIRQTFGIYFGTNTIYPLLATLETSGIIKSTWNIRATRPRKTYQITSDGKSVLSFAENSLQAICRKQYINPNK